MSNKINISNLEFDDIKQSLKDYLRSQDKFSDFDFEGSNMSVLLDVLAYNTHFNAMYMNMALNESYLDSASKRNSVVSLAKSIGYLPRSASCAKANISFVVSGTNTFPEFMTIGKNTSFQGLKDGVRYSFYIPEDITAEITEANTYIFSDVEIIEGQPVSNTFEYTENNVYILPNTSIDLNTLKVTVQETPTSTSFEVYKNGNEIANIGSTTAAYFIKEIDDGLYEINFGDDIIGKKLQPGNLVTVEYYVSGGTAPNGIRVFSYNGNALFGGTVTTIIVNSPANGGADPEDIEAIRINAPSFWQSQNRAVTAEDYRTILLNKVPNIKDVYVWGGEKNIPPVYGKVFIAATSTSDTPLTFYEKEEIKTNVLDQYGSISVIPEFVDPDYINIELDLVVYYNQALTNKSPSDLKSLIVSEYGLYNNNELKKFNTILRNSKIIQICEAVDRSITNVVPRLKLYYNLNPIFNINNNYTINLGNPIAQKDAAIKSTGFYVNNISTVVYFDNTAEGEVILYTLINGIRNNINVVGSVDFEKGIITLNNINVSILSGNTIQISAVPSSSDVVGIANKVCSLDMQKLNVSIVTEQLDKNNYRFTQNRL